MKITPPKLTQYQKDILLSDKRFTITEAATKCGKTFSHMWWLFYEAHQPHKQGANFWWVAPIYNQAEIAFKRIVSKIQRNPQYIINYSKLTIKTPNNTYLVFKSAENHNNLYGEDVFGCVFDEFTRAKVDSWYALRSTLTHTRGKCKLIGNFTGLGNWGHQLSLKAKEPNSEYAYFKVTAWDAVHAGILDENEILQAQKDLPKKVFAALYMAEAIEDDGQLIQNNKILEVFNNNFAIKNDYKVITCDIALTNDAFVVFVWHGFTVVDWFITNQIGSQELCNKIKEIAKQHSISESSIIYDADGIGNYLRELIPAAIGLNNNHKPTTPEYKNLKSELYFKFADFVNQSKISINIQLTDEQKSRFIEEMQMIRVDSEVDDKLEILRKSKVKEYLGHSPDITDALVYRMLYYLMFGY